MALSVSSDISHLSGVGEKRKIILYDMGIHTVGDLLLYFPRYYEHRGEIKKIRAADPQNNCSYILTVDTDAVPAPSKSRKGMVNYRLRAHDDTGDCIIMFFNQKYAATALRKGKRYRFFGKVKFSNSGALLLSPQYEPVTEDGELKEYLPVYPLRAGLTQKILRTMTERALNETNDKDSLSGIPYGIAEKEGFIGMDEALRYLHFPSSEEEIKKATDRMIYEELYIFALCIKSAGKTVSLEKSPKMRHVDLSDFLSQFPFPPTGAQKRSINEIYTDLVKKETPMYRLLSGDVGSGKTFPAAAAAYITVKNGYQAAMMAPTEILATQHYNDLSPIFENLGFRTALLIGSLKESEKKKIRASLAAGEIDFIFGTHALLSGTVSFKNAALFITDEQHRFGVNQRKSLFEKGKNPNILVMSATPIPRTLAMIIYGDLDVSVLDEMPPGRQPVSTFVVDSSFKERMFGYLEKQVSEGHQAYIVCPAISETVPGDEENREYGVAGGYIIAGNIKLEDSAPAPTLISAEGLYNTLVKTYPKIRFGLMHGKLGSDEKDGVMADFVSGKNDVLISTTVIEVGVNVPSATLMIIENAERFGLSQLHQLRGRVGRGSEKSYCILCSDDTSDKATKRLQALVDNRDGYKIAEFDLSQRGPGDFFPSGDEIKQHGALRFRFANLCDNLDVLHRAFGQAEATLDSDPDLSSEENLPSKVALEKLSRD